MDTRTVSAREAGLKLNPRPPRTTGPRAQSSGPRRRQCTPRRGGRPAPAVTQAFMWGCCGSKEGLMGTRAWMPLALAAREPPPVAVAPFWAGVGAVLGAHWCCTTVAGCVPPYYREVQLCAYTHACARTQNVPHASLVPPARSSPRAPCTWAGACPPPGSGWRLAAAHEVWERACC